MAWSFGDLTKSIFPFSLCCVNISIKTAFFKKFRDMYDLLVEFCVVEIQNALCYRCDLLAIK